MNPTLYTTENNTIIGYFNPDIYIAEIEHLIISFLDPLLDLSQLAQVNNFYYDIVNENKLYTALKKFNQERNKKNC